MSGGSRHKPRGASPGGARGRSAAGTSHVTRKRFGQHFLVDRSVIADIVATIDPQPEDRLVEIGPGLGALTYGLLAKVPRITAVEIDRDLAARWRREAPESVALIEADALEFDFASLGPDLRIVGNLPYNISTPLLFHLMDAASQVRDQVFMLQKEVVDRMVAGPGGRDYGRLSVMLQWRYRMSNVLDVPPTAFDPPPKVDSAVVHMVPLAPEERPPLDVKRLGGLVTAAFSQRRKLLRHSLGPWLESQCYVGPFDLQRRAEDVPVDEYIGLAQSLPTASA